MMIGSLFLTDSIGKNLFLLAFPLDALVLLKGNEAEGRGTTIYSYVL